MEANRDGDLSMQIELGLMNQEEFAGIVDNQKSKKPADTPQVVPLIPHLQNDIFALHEFFQSPTPPEVQAR
jgi:hypothetical protein